MRKLYHITRVGTIRNKYVMLNSYDDLDFLTTDLGRWDKIHFYIKRPFYYDFWCRRGPKFGHGKTFGQIISNKKEFHKKKIKKNYSR